MIECHKCGFYDSEFEACTCSSLDKWYACPVESKKPENIKALEEYAEWAKSELRVDMREVNADEDCD